MHTARVFLASGRSYVRRCVAHVLTMEGFDVVQASPEDTLDRAAAARPSLIILDAARNVAVTYSLCARIKREPELKDIPVQLIPPGPEDIWHDLARAAGAAGSLALVGDSSEIVACVSHVLEGLPPTGARVRVLSDEGGDPLQCRIVRSPATGVLRLVPIAPSVAPFGLAHGSRLQLADGARTWRAEVRSDGPRGLDVKVGRLYSLRLPA